MNYTKYAGHTPGPWHIAYGGLQGDGYSTIAAKLREKPLAETNQWPGYQEAEFVANAALIAAAPALLAENKRLREALEELVAEFDEQDREAGLQPGCYGINETGGIILARAALADEPEVEE